MSTTTRTQACTNAVPTQPRTSEGCYAVASLIDFHMRRARTFIQGSRFHRWNLRQTWHYMAMHKSHPGDIAAALDATATERRLLAALFAYRRAGVTHIRGSRWTPLKDAILNDAPPKRPLLVVNTGHGVVVDDGNGRASYPQAVGERFVGELWRNPNGEWWASRMGPDGTPTGMTASGPHRHADAAAYAVGFVVADH